MISYFSLLAHANNCEVPFLSRNKLCEYVEMTLNVAKNLLNFINDILDLSKVEAEKIDIHDSEFNMEDIFRSMPSIFIDQIHKKILILISMWHPMCTHSPSLIRSA